MNTRQILAPVIGVKILGVERTGGQWVISATSVGGGSCPSCGTQSKARHSIYWRRLQDLPVQGIPVMIRLRVARLRCRNGDCRRQIFVERVSGIAEPRLRRTCRVLDLVHLLGHTAGGRPAERLLRRLGFPASDDTIVHHLKRRARAAVDTAPLRVVGIDDWAWRKGQTYGTVMVDLERRKVVDILPERSSAGTAAWLRTHPQVEIVCRDRHGLFAEGTRDGAPQAIQVADRFHLIQNLRERIEQQLGRLGRPLKPDATAAAEREESRAGLHGNRERLFEQVRALYGAGKTATAITEELGLSRKRVDRWIRLEALPPRNVIATSTSSPGHFLEHLTRRWQEGCTMATRLFTEIKRLGYTGCYTHLARFVAGWRRPSTPRECVQTSQTATPITPLPRDPTTGRPLSPLTAAALCIKPRPLLTKRQATTVDALKAASSEFAVMRQLAMRFRGILRGQSTAALGQWLHDAHHSGIYAMQRFARTLQHDLEGVQNALTTRWSNGQAEGQISRLKTLKRAMYGRASVELLRARMLPL
jgi:transposase